MNNNDFFSIDKLVEFGLSATIASKMIQTMNAAFDKMTVPGCSLPNSLQQSTFYYAIVDGVQIGPCAESEILNLINSGRITKETYIWKPGLSNWLMAKDVPEILKLVALTPPPFNK